MSETLLQRLPDHLWKGKEMFKVVVYGGRDVFIAVVFDLLIQGKLDSSILHNPYFPNISLVRMLENGWDLIESEVGECVTLVEDEDGAYLTVEQLYQQLKEKIK